MVRRRRILHVKNFFTRSDVVFRRSVTIVTPFHIKGVFLIHEGHLINWSMAALTANPLVDVDVMLKIDEIWQVVNACPLQRNVVTIARPYGL